MIPVPTQTMPILDKTLVNNINKEACYPCQTNQNLDICIDTNQSASASDCQTKCKGYNSETYYYYDENGTKRCYCGKTKLSCDNFSSLTNVCTGQGNESCILNPIDLVNNLTVSEAVKNPGVCQEECKRILNADGLYCPGTSTGGSISASKCVCINPPSTNPSVYPTPPAFQCTPGSFTCKKGGTVAVPTNDKYYSYSEFLGKNSQPSQNDLAITAFCECDQKIKYNYDKIFNKPTADTFGNTPPVANVTLEDIWVESVTQQKENPLDDLYTIFNTKLNSATCGDVDKIKLLTAYEMCRITNDKYKRTIPAGTGPDPGKDGYMTWLKYQLGVTDTSKLTKFGTILFWTTRIVVYYILFHLIIKTFFHPTDKLSIMSSILIPPEVTDGKRNSINLLYMTTFGIISSIFLIYFIICWIKGSVEDYIEIIISYFFPSDGSYTKIFLSGFFMSLYFILAAAISKRISGINGIANIVWCLLCLGAYLVFLGFYLFDTDFYTDNATTKVKPQGIIGYIACIYLIIAISIFIYVSKTRTGDKRSAAFAYIFGTVYGTVPLIGFVVLLNLIIGYISPQTELILLIIHRFLSIFSKVPVLKYFISVNENSPWTLPFLPVVTAYIKLYYKASGSTKPDSYDKNFSDYTVSNTELWRS